MNEVILYTATFIHTNLRLLTPGGAKALTAENATLGYQMAILMNGRKCAPVARSSAYKQQFPQSRDTGIRAPASLSYLSEIWPDRPDEDQSWLNFLRNVKDNLYPIDFFRCKSAILKSIWVMVIMDQFTHQIIGFTVNAPPSG